MSAIKAHHCCFVFDGRSVSESQLCGAMVPRWPRCHWHPGGTFVSESVYELQPSGFPSRLSHSRYGLLGCSERECYPKMVAVLVTKVYCTTSFFILSRRHLSYSPARKSCSLFNRLYYTSRHELPGMRNKIQYGRGTACPWQGSVRVSRQE